MRSVLPISLTIEIQDHYNYIEFVYDLQIPNSTQLSQLSLLNNNQIISYLQQIDMADIEQIVHCLEVIQSGDTTQIKNAESKLSSLSKHANFLKILLIIPQLKGISQNVGKLASIYTRTYAKSLVLADNQANINLATNQMFLYLEKCNVPFSYRQEIAKTIEYLIKVDQRHIIVSAYQPNLVTMLNEVINTPDQEVNFQFLALFSQIMSKSPVCASKLPYYMFAESAFLPLVNIISRLLNFGSRMEKPEPQTIQKFLLLCKIYSSVLKKFMLRFMFFPEKLTRVLAEPLFSSLLENSIHFKLPENQLTNQIFYWNSSQQKSKITQYYHAFKANCIYSLTQALRVLTKSQDINYKAIASICNSPLYIQNLVKACDEYLEKCSYKLTSQYIVSIFQEVCNYLIACLRTGLFYEKLAELKPVILFGVVFRILSLSPDQYTMYYHEPEQFVNSLLHTIDINSASLLRHSRQSEENDEIEDFQTVKTISAHLLIVLTKYIDGCLSQIFMYSFSVLEDKLNVEYSKSLFLIVLAILRDQTKQRHELRIKMGNVIFRNLGNLEPPKMHSEEPYNVEYSLNLLILFRYFFLINEYQPKFYEKVFTYVAGLLQDEKVEEVPKILACEIVGMMAQDQSNQPILSNLVALLNHNITVKGVKLKLLSTLEHIIEQNQQKLSQTSQVVAEALNTTGKLLQMQLEKPSQNNLILIDHLWHIFESVSNSPHLLEFLLPCIHQNIEPLMALVDGENPLRFQSRIFKIISNMIKNTANVNEFDLQVIKVLPKIFYTGNCKYQLSSAFSVLQHIMYYGTAILGKYINDIKALTVLFLASINTLTANDKIRCDSDCVEGVLLLQSLIISCGCYFTQDIWVQLVTQLTNRLLNTPILCSFLSSNIVSTLGLIIMFGHRFFSLESNEELMKLVMTKYQFYTEQYSCRLFVICLGEMLTCSEYPFIQNRFAHLLDCIITLLKVICTSKNEFEGQEQLADEERTYKQLQSQILHKFLALDEFQIFRSQIDKLRNTNQLLLERAYQQLPEIKQQFFKEVANTRKVHQETRRIVRIKVNNTDK